CSMVFAGYLGKTAKIYFWIAGYFIYGLYSLALYYEPSVVVLYGLQIVGGAAYGMACACLRFILSYMETGSDGYAKTFNTMKLLSLFLGSVAFLISGLIVHYSSIQNIFFVSFVLVALCLVLAIVLIRKIGRAL